LVHRLAAVIDADRASLLAIGEDRQEIGQLGVTMLDYQPLDVTATDPKAIADGALALYLLLNSNIP
jgi:hypothetical protein